MASQTDALLGDGRDATHALLFESLVHGARLCVELVSSPLETGPSGGVDAELAIFESFAIAQSLRLCLFFRSAWWEAALPFLVLAAHFAVVARVYEGVSLSAAAAALVVTSSSAAPSSPYAPTSSAAATSAVLVLAYTYLQLHHLRTRSNVLRVTALAALFFAGFAHGGSSARLLCVLGLELSSWATERYMFPWRVPSPPDACGGYNARFLLSFFIGVHVVDVTQERVLVRPRVGGTSLTLTHTVRGVAVHGTRAFVRYRCSPMGVLLAYVEGLGLAPWTIQVEDDDPHVLRVRVWGGLYALRVHVDRWAPCDAADEPALLSASRFPFRRLLLGFLLRV